MQRKIEREVKRPVGSGDPARRIEHLQLPGGFQRGVLSGIRLLRRAHFLPGFVGIAVAFVHAEMLQLEAAVGQSGNRQIDRRSGPGFAES